MIEDVLENVTAVWKDSISRKEFCRIHEKNVTDATIIFFIEKFLERKDYENLEKIIAAGEFLNIYEKNEKFIEPIRHIFENGNYADYPQLIRILEEISTNNTLQLLSAIVRDHSKYKSEVDQPYAIARQALYAIAKLNNNNSANILREYLKFHDHEVARIAQKIYDKSNTEEWRSYCARLHKI